MCLQCGPAPALREQNPQGSLEARSPSSIAPCRKSVGIPVPSGHPRQTYCTGGVGPRPSGRLKTCGRIQGNGGSLGSE